MISVACVTDKDYLSYAHAMIRSFKEHHKDVDVYMYYIGCKNEYKNRDFNLFYDKTKLSSKKNILKKKSTEDNEYYNYFKNPILLSEKNCYCNNKRFEFVYDLLMNNVKNIVFSDADMLCNANIDFLKVLSFKKDICLQTYIDKNNEFFKTNFFYVNNTENSRIFFKKLSNNIDKKLGFFTWGHTKFFTDEAKNSNLKIVNLPEDFVDTNYKENSYIWSGESFRKNRDLVEISSKNFNYINKFEKYNE